MLERLSDMIRPLVSWRPNKEQTGRSNKAEAGEENKPAQETGALELPEGATGNGGFRVTPDMTSVIGCSGEEFASVLKLLGFACERKPLAATLQTQQNGAQNAAASEEKSGDTDAEDRQVMDEIWRPCRKAPRIVVRKGQHRKSHVPRGKAGHAVKRAASARPKRARKPKPHTAIDPDSPFAALKDLKRDLQKRVKDPS